jgi:imidazolonepropionase-like amidohydrolase
MPDRGWIRTGAIADLVLLSEDSYLHLPYRPDSSVVDGVIKRGVVL